MRVWQVLSDTMVVCKIPFLKMHRADWPGLARNGGMTVTWGKGNNSLPPVSFFSGGRELLPPPPWTGAHARRTQAAKQPIYVRGGVRPLA